MRNFAEREGWKFIDRTAVSSDEEKKWTDFQGKATFPLPGPPDHSYVDNYPRHVAGPSILLVRFASGWMREDPGTNEMTPAYGYVLFSKDGSRMAVYHQWGNG